MRHAASFPRIVDVANPGEPFCRVLLPIIYSIELYELNE